MDDATEKQVVKSPTTSRNPRTLLPLRPPTTTTTTETIQRYEISPVASLSILNQHSSVILRLVELHDGTLLTGSNDGTMKRWSLTGELLATFVDSDFYISDVIEHERDQTLISSGSTDDKLRVWKTATGECIRRSNKLSGAVWNLLKLRNNNNNDNNNNLFACGLLRGTIEVRDSTDLEVVIRSFSGHKAGITAMRELRDGSIVSSSYDGTIKRWKMSSSACIRTFVGHHIMIWKLIELSDGTIASCSVNGLVKRWDVETSNCLHTFEGHSSAIRSIGELRDGALVSGALDKTIRVWDKRGECLAAYEAPDIVTDLLVLRDGSIAFSFGEFKDYGVEVHQTLNK